ncbi:MAG: hypothetical protein HZA01_16225 [Nitrospinae bacterium]|nr:hypothetical protein [Nitrospinota bacterium]
MERGFSRKKWIHADNISFDMYHKPIKLDFPAIFVDGSNSAGAEFQVIGKQDNFTAIDFVLDHHTPEEMRTPFFSFNAGKANDLVRQNRAV